MHLVVFDFETTGLSATESEAIQVAGKAYDPLTFDPVPISSGGEFCSMMRPLYPEKLDDPGVRKALSVNKKTKEEILAAPDQKVVWNQFVDWVNKFNPSRKLLTAPMAGGKNIRDFDMKFVAVLNRLHCKKEGTLLFHPKKLVELEDQILQWFWHSDELENVKMDTLRDYFGMSREGGHDALIDVRQTGELITGFLKLQKELRLRTCKDGTPLLKFQGSRKGM